MKIGILTFHSQLNYGGVLQCWALQTALEKMGHIVRVIDRWHDKDNSFLECGLNKWRFRPWVRFLFRSLMGLGDVSQFCRSRRTKEFLKLRLHLTSYHFVEWKDAPIELGVDLLVVGSDQVWHCGDWGDPRVYLLDGAPQIPAIAYAASFGMAGLPVVLGVDAKAAEEVSAEQTFKRGLARFKSISCREQEGVEICRQLGFDAIHVVDPTLLTWGVSAKERSQKPKQRELICYFLSEKIENHIYELDAFARRNDCKVKVFMDNAWLLPFPSNFVRIKNLLCTWRHRLSSHVDIIDSAGPEEFYQGFKSAKWVVSDSFHALMLSICNGCDSRIIRPVAAHRKRMFARIEEFANHTKGPLVVDSISDALISINNGEKVEYDYKWIDECIRKSQHWLQANLK